MPPHLYIAPEVAHAVQTGQPVVALESTVIAHGLPHPANVETALAMEDAIRAQGAVPATIAILQGRIAVGLTREEIAYLSNAPDVKKVSRRDLAVVCALGQDGATTVAGTMIVAHMAGIPVFATGGIGGVHRGHPFDVSADLIELGRTPVMVVCAGAKSILDVPLTLEVLETHGVPVIGYGTDMLPAFYTRSSGLPVSSRVDTPHDAARIVVAARELGMRHGFLLNVPIPTNDELPASDAEVAIQRATAEAEAWGITGKDVTPFVLAQVAKMTGGASQKANIALLINNARVAAQIAVEIAALTPQEAR